MLSKYRWEISLHPPFQGAIKAWSFGTGSICALITAVLVLGGTVHAQARTSDGIITDNQRGNPKLIRAEQILGDFEAGRPGTRVIVTLQRSSSEETLAAADDRFLGRSGDGCAGTGPCNVSIDRDRALAAEFVSFPWFLFLPVLTGRGAGGGDPEKAYWRGENDRCCPTSSSTFVLTLAGITTTSTLASCTALPTWDDWVEATPGEKSFLWQWSSAGCNEYIGTFSYTLAPGLSYRFVLGWNGSSFTLKVYAADTATMSARASFHAIDPASEDTGTMTNIDEIVLDMPAEAMAAAQKTFNPPGKGK